MSVSNGIESRNVPDDPSRELAMRHIFDALRCLKFGVVSIIVQDGEIVQVERTDKRRVRRKDAFRFQLVSRSLKHELMRRYR